MKRIVAVTLALLVPGLWLLAAEADKPGEKHAMVEVPTKAICVLHPTKDSKVHGILTFTQKGQAILIAGEITGLTPGLHAFHVHEFGDCSAPDATSAGGHFNPDKKPHGGPHAAERHVGDLGNITADRTGKAVLKMEDEVIALHGPHSIIGRSVIIHAKADDLKTQPTGDAGGRVACGVIGIAKADMAATK